MMYQNFASNLPEVMPPVNIRRRGVASGFATPAEDLNAYLRAGMQTADQFRVIDPVLTLTSTSGVGSQAIEATTHPTLIARINGSNLEIISTTTPTVPYVLAIDPTALPINYVSCSSHGALGFGEIIVAGAKTQRFTLDTSANTVVTKSAYRYFYDKGSQQYVFYDYSSGLLRSCPPTDLSGSSDTLHATFASGQLVAASDGGKFLLWSTTSNSGWYSVDGVSWSSITTNALALGLHRVCTCRGLFFATRFASPGVYSSPDGQNWQLLPFEVTSLPEGAWAAGTGVQGTDQVIIMNDSSLVVFYGSIDLGRSWFRLSVPASIGVRASQNRLIYTDAASSGTVRITGEL